MRVSARLPIDEILTLIRQFPESGCFWVAYSGGVDSHVLLHALSAVRESLPGKLGAVHVDHTLHPDSGNWSDHCRSVCANLMIPFQLLPVDARAAPGTSPEAAARDARYRVIAEWLPPGDVLLSAHHQDDQAETLLLQLMRGSGPRGLASMPIRVPLGRGSLLRPLLSVTRSVLLDYAQSQGLQWIEDPSNTDTGIDRNFLRHLILPVLRQRWPSASASITRCTGLCAESSALMDMLAADDLLGFPETPARTLPIPALRALPVVRQRNLLRFWLRRQGVRPPSHRVLERVEREVLKSRTDASPRVVWGGVEIRRYRDLIHLLPVLPVPDPGYRMDWSLDKPLRLPAAGGILTARPGIGNGLKAGASVQVRYRQGGEICRPSGRNHHHALKKLYQERGIPPWERERIPLIYVDRKLAAVAGLWICEPFQARAGEAGMEIDWQPEIPALFPRGRL